MICSCGWNVKSIPVLLWKQDGKDPVGNEWSCFDKVVEEYNGECSLFGSGNVSMIGNGEFISGKVVSISGKIAFITSCCKEESIIGKLESIIDKVLWEHKWWRW